MSEQTQDVGMVERVARALDELCQHDGEDVKAMARAAIEAMREPTEAMVASGHGWDGIARCYMRMIDAALGEKP